MQIPNQVQFNEDDYKEALSYLEKYLIDFNRNTDVIYRQWTEKTKDYSTRSKSRFWEARAKLKEHICIIIQKAEQLKKQGEPIHDLVLALGATHLRLTDSLNAKADDITLNAKADDITLNAKAYNIIARKMQRKPSTGMKALGCALILLGVAIIAVICLPMVPPMVGFASFAAAAALGTGITFFSSDKSLSEKMRKMNKKLDELTIKYQTSSADSPSKDAVISSATC